MRYSLASQKVINERFRKAKLFRTEPDGEFSGWVIIANNESSEMYERSADHFDVVENEFIESYLPDFKRIKYSESDSIFVHNEALDQLVEINTELTRSLSNGAFATNQSNVKVDFKQWYRHVKRPLRKYYWLIGLSILFLPIGTIVSGLVIIYSVRKIRAYKEEIQECYIIGNTIPGIVTGVNPTTVAVMTDLSTGIGYYPIVKVFEYKAKKLSGNRIKVGDTMPMTTVYYGQEGSTLNYWLDIDSFPVEFATRDRKKIGEKRYSISVLDWSKLEENVAVLGDKSTRPGVYKIEIEKSDWVNV